MTRSSPPQPLRFHFIFVKGRKTASQAPEGDGRQSHHPFLTTGRSALCLDVTLWVITLKTDAKCIHSTSASWAPTMCQGHIGHWASTLGAKSMSQKVLSGQVLLNVGCCPRPRQPWGHRAPWILQGQHLGPMWFLQQLVPVHFIINILKHVFIYLVMPGVSCGTWDLAPCWEAEPEPPALTAES